MKRWPVVSKPYRQGREHRFYVGELPAIDEEWVLLTGEILFNLRSSLDHLAYQLHVRRRHPTIPLSKVEGRTQFPIYDAEKGWKDNYDRIARLSKPDRTALRQLQPCVTRKDKWQVTRYWLSRLNGVHNFDKHRKLHVVAGSQNTAYDTTSWFPVECGFESHTTWGPVEFNIQVDRWTFTSPPPKMRNHPGVFLHVTLEYGSTFAELVPFLESVFNATGDVLRRFSDRFPPANIPERFPLIERYLPYVSPNA